MQIEHDDGLLIRRVQEGDIRAFEILVRRYEHKLVSFVMRYLGNKSASEEVVQDVFFSVYKTIGRVDPTRKFLSYLFAIAHNRAISYLRRQKHHERLDEALHMPTPENAADYSSIHYALTQLPEKYRRVLHMYYFDDVSYERISRLLDIPINTVRTHISRAKILVKKFIEL